MYSWGWVLCPPALSSIPDRVPEMDENWTFRVYSSLCAKGGAQDRFILDSTFLDQICDWNYVRNSLCVYKMFYLLTTERQETEKVSVWEAPWWVTVRIGISVNKCAYFPGVLSFPDAKLWLLKLRSCRHGQPMDLKQLPGCNSSSFKWQMNQPMGGLLQIQSFEPSYHLHPVGSTHFIRCRRIFRNISRSKLLRQTLSTSNFPSR
jgi:hypothetical protein